MQDAVEMGPGLSQGALVADTFIAPSKTFTDLRHHAKWWSWLVPFILIMLLSFVFAWALLHKIGVNGLVEGLIHSNPGLDAKVSNASPEIAAKIRASISGQFSHMYFAPLILLVMGVVVSAIFLATANFVFGGTAKYKQVLAVWFYGTLPLMLMSILTIIIVMAGATTDYFNIKNAVGTNIGYYLQGGSTPQPLVVLLSSVDVFAIWSALLLTIGLSIVAGIKRSSAAIVVFGWWFLYVLLQMGLATLGM